MKAYLDYASTTPVEERVKEAMEPYFNQSFGNPTSIYSFSQEARKAMEEGRARVAELINARPEEIVFTSSGTEACNLGIKGAAFKNRKKGKHIVVSSVEHFAVLEAAKWLEKHGFEVTYLPCDQQGTVRPESLEEAVREDTTLVSVMHANNEIGTIEPIEELAGIAEDRDIPFFTDACVSNGFTKLDVEELNVDLMALSAHKMYGPKGVGALFVGRGTRVEPLIHGGGQENRIRSGTENVPGIVGMGRAAEIARKEMNGYVPKMEELRDILIREISGIEKTKLQGHPERRLPNNANFTFAFIEGEGLILELDFEGISASTGSACSSPTLEPSHVLTSTGLSHSEAHGSLRLSLGKETTREEVDHVVEVLPGIVKRLRDISPFKQSFDDYVEGTEWKGGGH